MPEKPIISAVPTRTTDSEAPQGDELFAYVAYWLGHGRSIHEVRGQLIAFGYSASDSEEVVDIVSEWRITNPGDAANLDAPQRFSVPPISQAPRRDGSNAAKPFLIGLFLLGAGFGLQCAGIRGFLPSLACLIMEIFGLAGIVIALIRFVRGLM